ncbi:MAG: cell division protein FtsA [Bacillota bacterium]
MSGLKPSLMALEVGSSKICAAVFGPEDELLGFAAVPLPGFPERSPSFFELVEGMAKATDEAKAMAETHGKKVWVILSPAVVRAHSAKGLVKVSGPEGKVNRGDLARAVAAACTDERGVIHRLFLGSALDGREVLEDPIGLAGDRLEVDLLFVRADEDYCLGLRQAAMAAGLEIAGFLAGFLCLGSVLSPAEREIGTAVVDLGAAHTTAVVYLRGRLRAVIPSALGSLHLTKDLAVVFGFSRRRAEELKKAIFSRSTKKDEQTDRAVRVMGARLGEIFALVRQELEDNGWMGKLAGGFVLTGGGAVTEEILAIAREVLMGPVRLGFPQLEYFSGIMAGPGYAAILGAAQAIRAYGAEGMEASTKGVTRWRSWSLRRRMPT